MVNGQLVVYRTYPKKTEIKKLRASVPHLSEMSTAMTSKKDTRKKEKVQ